MGSFGPRAGRAEPSAGSRHGPYAVPFILFGVGIALLPPVSPVRWLMDGTGALAVGLPLVHILQRALARLDAPLPK